VRKYLSQLAVIFMTVMYATVGQAGQAQSSSFSFGDSFYRVKEGNTVEIPLFRNGGSSGEARVFI